MLIETEAVYENGVLHPLDPLPLAQREHVKITVARTQDEDWIDWEFMDACAADADGAPSLDQVRSALSKIRGSMDEAIDQDRGKV
jgi:hypothetical protein